MPDNFHFATLLDGHPATANELAPLTFAGFAHFTAMQIRAGKVRGLDLHLKRLGSASLQMFGVAHSDEDVITHLRSAISMGPSDLSLTATVFSRLGEFTPTGAANDPAILIRSSPPSDGPTGPLKLDTVTYQRPLPELKHVGETTKTYFLRKAVERGFDDAAYLDDKGNLSEATIWNLAFWDGNSVIWPKAEILRGITMQIIDRQLKKLGVSTRSQHVSPEDIKSLSGAVVMNSWTPGIAVEAIGDKVLPISDSFLDLLHEAYQREPETAIN